MNRKNNKILLIGGCRKAKSLAVSLLEQGYQVTVINNDYDYCLKLAQIENLRVIYGDGTKPNVLEEAGGPDFDIAIAITSKDADNLVACQLCKKKFGIAKTVALVGDPNKREFFTRIGVDSVVCAISTVTAIIQQQAFVDEMTNIMPVGQGRVQIIEVQIPKDSNTVGKKLSEISLPNEGIVGCVIRGDTTIIPRGNTHIFADDTLIVITESGHEKKMVNVLTGRKWR